MVLASFMKIAVLVAGGLAISAVILLALSSRRHGGKREPVPMPTSLSVLAGLSFFLGLGAILLVTTTGILSLILSMGELLHLPSESRPAIELAGQIALYVSLLPAVGAMAFALAARGVISESRDTVRGRPLYRTGVLLAIVTGVVVFDAKIVNPAAWLSGKGLSWEHVDRALSTEDFDRGYLGVEYEGIGSPRVIRVVPGSPADKAGLQAGDRVLDFDGSQLLETGPALQARIQALKPGSRVVLTVRRGTETLSLTAELSAPFERLLKVVDDQSFDQERLTVLKAAGADRRYSADELTRLCRTFDFDDGKLKAIEAALPHLLDPQNAYSVLSTLDFSDAKKKASGWIAERTKSPR